ncbi:MAG: IS4 family transposase, partial [Gallionella sp.]
MPHVIRNRVNQQIDRFRKSFLQFQDLPFNDFFPATVIADIIKHTPHQRTSVFTPLVTLKAFIFQVLSDDGSCKHAVAGVLTDRLGDGKTANTVNTGPYCKARKRLPSKQLTEAVTNVGSRLHQQMPEAWRWKGYNVV